MLKLILNRKVIKLISCKLNLIVDKDTLNVFQVLAILKVILYRKIIEMYFFLVFCKLDLIVT